MNKRIFHYTSIETLLLILKNKTIRFTSLGKVDDMNEGMTSDYGTLGRFCYVSCWTETPSESIPQWNMYSSDMEGVRISIPYPTNIEEVFECAPYQFTDGTSKNIPLAMFPERLDPMGVNPPYLPEYFEVTYTSDKALLYPKVYTYKKIKNGYEENISNLSLLGKFKEKKWKFQEETRFKIFLTPWSLNELKSVQSSGEQIELFGRLKETRPFYDYLDLDLMEECLSKIQVTCGPKVSDAQKEIIQLILDKYSPGKRLIESQLQIR